MQQSLIKKSDTTADKCIESFHYVHKLLFKKNTYSMKYVVQGNAATENCALANTTPLSEIQSESFHYSPRPHFYYYLLYHLNSMKLL